MISWSSKQTKIRSAQPESDLSKSQCSGELQKARLNRVVWLRGDVAQDAHFLLYPIDCFCSRNEKFDVGLVIDHHLLAYSHPFH